MNFESREVNTSEEARAQELTGLESFRGMGINVDAAIDAFTIITENELETHM